jgi:hypothetical protein
VIVNRIPETLLAPHVSLRRLDGDVTQQKLGHDKEGRAERKDEKLLKIDVASIHHVEGPSLRHDLVEEIHIMHGTRW